MLPEQNVFTIPFTSGTNEGVDKRVLSPPFFRSIVNGFFNKEGSLRKRPGYSQRGNGAVMPPGYTTTPITITSGNKLGYGSGTNFALSTGKEIYSYSNMQDSWHLVDYQMPHVVAGQRVCVSPGGTTSSFHDKDDIYNADVAHYSGGLTVYAWLQVNEGGYGTILYSIRDIAGNIITPATILLNGSAAHNYNSLKLTIVDTKCVITYLDSNNAANIYAANMNMLASSPSFGAGSAIVTNFIGTAGAQYDMCAIEKSDGSASTQFIVASLRAGGAIIDITKFSNTFVSAGTVAHAVVAATTVKGVGVFSRTSGASETEYTVIAYGNTTAAPDYRVHFASYLTNAFAAGIGNTQAFTFSAGDNGGDFFNVTLAGSGVNYNIAASASVTANLLMAGQKVNVSTGAIIGQRHASFHLQIASKMKLINSRPYFMARFCTVTNGQFIPQESSGHFLIDMSDTSDNLFRDVARFATRQCSIPFYPTYGLANIVQVKTKLFETVMLCDISGSKRSLFAMPIDFGEPRDVLFNRCGGFGKNMHSMLEANNELAAVAGTPFLFDGGNIIENGFNFYPVGASGVGSVVSGTLDLGTYGYAVVYESVDNAGNIHQSAPVKFSVTTTGGGARRCDLTIPPYSLTMRHRWFYGASSGLDDSNPRVNIVIYRTKVNDSVFFRLTNVRNIPYAKEINFIDDGTYETDATLSTKAKLYTEGEIPNLCPPSATCQRIHKNRQWLAGTDNPTQLWMSKLMVPGEWPGFNDDFVISIPNPITGLAVLNGELIIFTAKKIYALSGDGPDDTGAGGDLQQPRELQVNIGCIDPRSVVEFPGGIIFQGQTWLYLLANNGSISRITEIEDTISAYPYVQNAVLVPDMSHIRFALKQDDEDTEGIWLVYDYRFNAWFIWQHMSGDAAVGATIANGTYNWVRASGVVYKEAPNSWVEEGLYIPTYFETGEIHVANLQGFQRIWKAGVLLERFSPARLTFNVYSDYSSTPSQSHTFSENDLTTTKVEPNVYIKQQRCQSIRLAVQDIAPLVGSPGQGYGYTAITLLVGTEPGMNRVAKGQSA